jgi:hypothetical protein
MQDQVKSRSAGTDSDALPVQSVPAIVIVRNSADDKSNFAFARIQKAFANWEDALRRYCFENASLPIELENPLS